MEVNVEVFHNVTSPPFPPVATLASDGWKAREQAHPMWLWDLGSSSQMVLLRLQASIPPAFLAWASSGQDRQVISEMEPCSLMPAHIIIIAAALHQYSIKRSTVMDECHNSMTSHSQFKSVSLPIDMVALIEKEVTNNPLFLNTADFVRTAVREKLEVYERQRLEQSRLD